VCQQGTRLTNNILKLKITTKKSALESVRQIIKQKPAMESGVRQPKKVDRKMIGMGAKSITVGRAVTADFVFDCRAAEVLSDE
jgi:putative N-acetylmannosamine-6-phosphate epimerase